DAGREVAMLSAAGDDAPETDSRRLTADSADAGPGRLPAGRRTTRHLPQLLASAAGDAESDARAAAGTFPAALRRSRAPDDAVLPDVPGAAGSCRLRHRRGPLYQRMGPRLPPGVPPAGESARAFSEDADDGVDSDSHGEGAGRHPPAPA